MYSKVFMQNISRNCSTFFRILQGNGHRNKSCLVSQQSYTAFENSLSNILNRVPQETFTPEILENLKKITEYSVNGKQNFRGALALYTYETLEKPDNITEKTSNQIRTLAWGAEMVHSYFMILDDIENSDGKIRKKYGWYLHDASLFRSYVYEILKYNFVDLPTYGALLQLFDKAFLYTAIGHQLDNASKTRRNYDNFTMDHYDSIVKYKTSFHTFKFPMFLAIKLIDDMDEFSYQQVEHICTDIGRLYQIRNDFSNCYGAVSDQSGIPKHSKDILEGKCSWLAVTALQRCSAAQRIVFTSCYGSKEPAHIERVKLLYDQLQMPAMYKEEEDRICKNVKHKTDRLHGTKLTPELFQRILDLIKNEEFED